MFIANLKNIATEENEWENRSQSLELMNISVIPENYINLSAQSLLVDQIPVLPPKLDVQFRSGYFKQPPPHCSDLVKNKLMHTNASGSQRFGCNFEAKKNSVFLTFVS